MKVVILAGGLGTRIAEATSDRPKPMVEIGGMPILWHIMKIFSHYGLYDFIICCGYKGYVIKEFFVNYFLHRSDVTVDMRTNSVEIHNKKVDPWRVTLVDTGEQSQTGGRLARVADFIDGDFCMTYGDGVGSVDIKALVDFHRAHGGLATMTTVRPPGRFGAVVLEGSKVSSFVEKPAGDGGRINGGYFVLSPTVLDLIDDDSTVWEAGPLESLANSGELFSFCHEGFWQPMDTVRDRSALESLWASGSAPWRIWAE
jgi:glucose-1-phosphate cytidylyltransferase